LQYWKSLQHSGSSETPGTNGQYPVEKVASLPQNLPNAVKGDLLPGRITKQTIIPYGSDEGQIGILRGEGGHPVSGPESFAIGGDGRVYVADALNHRVLVYSESAQLLRTISLTGIGLADLTVDGKGNMYVYDDAERKLSEFSSDGSPLRSLLLNPGDIVSRGYVHIEGQSVFFANSASTDILIAHIEEGVLTAADVNLDRNSDGVHSSTGKVYSIDVTRGQAMHIIVHKDSEVQDEQNFSMSLSGILSATYVGEDDNDEFYIQTERSDGTAVALEVRKFDLTGQQVGSTRIQETDYALGTTKLLGVRHDGAIVQFLPQNDQAKLQILQ